jgi:hypothetical protein
MRQFSKKRLKKWLHPSTCSPAVGGVHVLVWADLCDTPSKGRAGGGQGGQGGQGEGGREGDRGGQIAPALFRARFLITSG